MLLLLGLLMVWVWRAHRPAKGGSVEVVAPWTTAAARAAQRSEVRNRSIEGNFGLPLTPEYEGRWQSFLGAVKWTSDRRPEVLAEVRRRLTMPPLETTATARAVEVQRLAMETAHGLFPVELEEEMRRIFLTDYDAKRVAMAGAWLRRKDGSPGQRESLAAALRGRFSAWQAEPRFLALVTELEAPRQQFIAQRPPLADLLKAPFDGRPVVFSFQRVDRSWLGRAVVRHGSGRFVVEPDGSRFSVTQFALSASGLPGTLTNGNTPCGIFEITKVSTTRNTRHRSHGDTRSLACLWSMTPSGPRRVTAVVAACLEKWWPIREAWWAGQAGRNEILAHGTAIDPAPWMDTVFAGQTPSHGCLTCDESWDPATGQRISSEQCRLIERLAPGGRAAGLSDRGGIG